MIHVEFDLNTITVTEASTIVELLVRRFPTSAGKPTVETSSTLPTADARNIVEAAHERAIPESASVDSAAESAPGKAKRGRPRKEEAAVPENPTPVPNGPVAAVETSPEPPSQPASVGDLKALTVDELRGGLQKYTVAHGLVDGKALLDSFGCVRVTDLVEKGAEVHAQFMAKCNA